MASLKEGGSERAHRRLVGWTGPNVKTMERGGPKQKTWTKTLTCMPVAAGQGKKGQREVGVRAHHQRRVGPIILY